VNLERLSQKNQSAAKTHADSKNCRCYFWTTLSANADKRFRMHQCEADKEYVLLAAPSFQLVILQIPQRIAASITIDKPPRKRENTPIKLVIDMLCS
jgi:hypothetical protein